MATRKGYKTYAYLEFYSPKSYHVQELVRDLKAHGYKTYVKYDGEGTYVYRSIRKYKRQSRKQSHTRRLGAILFPMD